ncbi:MAG TPA: hypothetical protein VHM90_17995 [Phycisphaerae bacterium]|jgi:hypothetical protein|nr:hypothetical protein [Phycisphaerae bacterium]
MNRNTFSKLALAATLAFGLSAMAQTTAPQNLDAMKARLAELKKEAAELEAKIAAAEAPAAGTEPAIITALNAMPKNLWPGDGDSEIKTSLRDKWLTENIKPGTPGTFTGTVIVSSASTLYPPGKPPVEGVRVVIDAGRHVVWGKEVGLKVTAVLENVAPADTLDWGDKKSITLTGNIKDCRPNNPVEIMMETSRTK